MAKRLDSGSVVLSVFLLSLGSGRLAAQQSLPTYGVNSTSVAVVSAWEMQPGYSETMSDVSSANGYRYLTESGTFYSVVHMPQGARILSIELDACDTTPIGQLTSALYRMDSAGFTPLASVSTGTNQMPGCSRFAEDVTQGPNTVDNYAYQYLFLSNHTGMPGTTSIGAVRVFYQLQVSPAPAVATFNDVPTSDPGFQYIEALVASGITAGCGGGNFCPDATLTRRQMAVFLAKALGLHWNEQPDN